jgi:hypothetical protein
VKVEHISGVLCTVGGALVDSYFNSLSKTLYRKFVEPLGHMSCRYISIFYLKTITVKGILCGEMCFQICYLNFCIDFLYVFGSIDATHTEGLGRLINDDHIKPTVS